MKRMKLLLLVLISLLAATPANATNDLGHRANYQGSIVRFNHISLTSWMHSASTWNEGNLDTTTDIVVSHHNNVDPNLFPGVNVYDSDYGDTTWAARWFCTVWYATSCLTGTIQYNQYHVTSSNANYHKALACHEEGHAVGLNHAANTCMQDPAGPLYKTYTQHDRAIINGKY